MLPASIRGKAFIMADILLNLPSSIHFSNLKLLTLQYVVFPGYESTQQLFSGLPVLEELTLDSCCWLNFEIVTIALPMLKKLDIKENLADHDNCQFFIIAENLNSFYYIDTLKNDYWIYNTVSLDWGLMGLCSTDDIGESSRLREVAQRAGRLRGISCAKELLLTPYAFEALAYSEYLCACMPVASVCLGIMKEEVGYWILYLLLVSQDISSSLGCQFCGTDGELQVVMNLLKHAEILLQMDIICHHEKFSGGLARERDVLEQLRMLPRASTYCTINIS
ncbi:putative FBD-associated F-box protein [Glycine max]|nr:putative FBD-associated F-box protein [Glycine max]